MLRFIIFFTVFITFSISAFAQESFSLLHSIDKSLASIFTNPAGLSTLKKSAVLIQHENPFLLDELESNSIGICSPLKASVFAISFKQFGSEDYLLQHSKLSLGRSFGKFSGGISFSYRYEFINDGFGATHNMRVDLGIQIDFSNAITAGFQIQNPGGNPEINEPILMSIGCKYEINTLTKIAIELEKENKTDPISKLSLQYKYYKNFELLFAIQNGEQAYQIGNAFTFHQFQCQLNTSYHVQLGFGLQYLLSFQLQ